MGCEQGTRLIGPAGADTTSGGGGGVERATLTVVVRLTGEDSAVASQLGLDRGVLPGAEVRLRRRASDAEEMTATTDSAGRATFEHLLGGRYDLSALRVLRQAEIGRLNEANQDVTGFGVSATSSVEVPARVDTLVAVAGRRGSLVFSELEASSPQVPTGGFSSYWFGHYVEVYNNADTTIYLDGKVIVLGMIFGVRDRNETFNCETMAKWQLDPEGIWTSRFVEAFPGSGSDYPFRPGEAAVVATDAIDHTEIDARLPDLSSADFEFIGSVDVDNPAVPNMVTLGRRFGDNVFGHGLLFQGPDIILVLADPVDVATLLKEDIPGAQPPEHWRIPADKILDVLAVGPTPDEEPLFGQPRCPMWTASDIDQQEASLFKFDVVNAFRRRELGVLPDGRVVLQRTKNSARDLRGGSLTPGEVP